MTPADRPTEFRHDEHTFSNTGDLVKPARQLIRIDGPGLFAFEWREWSHAADLAGYTLQTIFGDADNGAYLEIYRHDAQVPYSHADFQFEYMFEWSLGQSSNVITVFCADVNDALAFIAHMRPIMLTAWLSEDIEDKRELLIEQEERQARRSNPRQAAPIVDAEQIAARETQQRRDREFSEERWKEHLRAITPRKGPVQ